MKRRCVLRTAHGGRCITVKSRAERLPGECDRHNIDALPSSEVVAKTMAARRLLCGATVTPKVER